MHRFVHVKLFLFSFSILVFPSLLLLYFPSLLFVCCIVMPHPFLFSFIPLIIFFTFQTTKYYRPCKVKCTLVQAPMLCTGRTAQRGSRGIALLFHDHATRRGWGVSVTPRPLFYPGKDPVPIVQEAGWAPGSVWTVAENLIPTGIQSLDHPARSQSLYWLHYPAHTTDHIQDQISYSDVSSCLTFTEPSYHFLLPCLHSI